MNPLEQNLRRIRGQIPDHITILAASKRRTVEEILQIIEMGVRDIGFNYLQEGVRVIRKLPPRPDLRFHFIGHLQSNKVKDAVKYFHSVDTVHSERLAALIHRACLEPNKIMDILIQVKSEEETHKNGVLLKNAISLVRSMAPYRLLNIRGLMAMGPNVDKADLLRNFFRNCSECLQDISELSQENLHPEVLSMGMSDSFLQAIQEGATEIRLGTAIYGPRSHF